MTIKRAIEIIALDNGYVAATGKYPEIQLSAKTAKAVTAALRKLTADQASEILTGDVETAAENLVAQGVLSSAEVAVINKFADRVFETLELD